MDTAIISAIRDRNLIEMVYENQWIIVQPHCYGVSQDNTECLVAFMVDGFPPGAIHTWNIYDLEKADDFNILKETFPKAAKGYGQWLARIGKVYVRL